MGVPIAVPKGHPRNGPGAPIDAALRRLGYCGAVDDTEWRRCYRRAGHHGKCTFSENFQLRHPRLGPGEDDRPTR